MNNVFTPDFIKKLLDKIYVLTDSVYKLTDIVSKLYAENAALNEQLNMGIKNSFKPPSRD